MGSSGSRSAARRGQGLPPLSPPEREALIRQTGPALLQAVDRVLGELRRLKATPGLRSDFDRLIDAYTRDAPGDPARGRVSREPRRRKVDGRDCPTSDRIRVFPARIPVC